MNVKKTRNHPAKREVKATGNGREHKGREGRGSALWENTPLHQEKNKVHQSSEKSRQKEIGDQEKKGGGGTSSEASHRGKPIFIQGRNYDWSGKKKPLGKKKKA